MVTTVFRYKGIEYTLKVPQTGDTNYVGVIENDDTPTGLVLRRKIVSYTPDFQRKALSINVERVLLDANGGEIQETSRSNDSYNRQSDAEFAYFFPQKNNGVDIIKQLINGLLFDLSGFRVFSEAGDFLQPISFTVSATTPTLISGDSYNEDGSLSVTLVDFDNTQTIEYSIDGGSTWQSSNTFTGLAKDLSYNVKVKYVGTEFRTSPTVIEYTSYETVTGTL